jgi:hypothetical protein
LWILLIFICFARRFIWRKISKKICLRWSSIQKLCIIYSEFSIKDSIVNVSKVSSIKLLFLFWFIFLLSYSLPMLINYTMGHMWYHNHWCDLVNLTSNWPLLWLIFFIGFQLYLNILLVNNNFFRSNHEFMLLSCFSFLNCNL